MLPDTEKERIREEESFRIEVRRLIAPPEKESTGANGFWKFLNSPFALWLLSSVLITLVTAGITSYLNKRSSERERAQSIRKLTIEAGYRISRLDEFITQLSKDYATNPNPDDGRDLVKAGQMEQFRLSLNMVDKEGVFKELSDRPLLSLLWELQSLVDGDKKADVESAFHGAQVLHDLTWKWSDTNEIPRTDFLTMLEKLDKDVLTSLRRLPT
jgi:hypothetical protein